MAETFSSNLHAKSKVLARALDYMGSIAKVRFSRGTPDLLYGLAVGLN